MQNLNFLKYTNECIYKSKEIYRHRKQRRLLKGKVRGELNQEAGINTYNTTIYKICNQKDLLYSTGNGIQYFVVTKYIQYFLSYKGKES